MHTTKYVDDLIYDMQPRWRAVLFCLAAGQSISETSRTVHISRGAIYAMLADREFKEQLVVAQLSLAVSGTIEQQSTKYREKVLRSVVKLLEGLPKSKRLIEKFRRRLDVIDRMIGVGAVSSERVWDDVETLRIWKKNSPPMRKSVRRMIKLRRKRLRRDKLEQARYLE